MLASQYDRPVGFGGILPLPILTMAGFCDRFDGDQEDLEKMIYLERLMYPKMVEKNKEDVSN
jgi:hypothetical protein